VLASFISALQKKVKTRDKICSDLTEQIKIREHFVNLVAKEMELLESTLSKAAEAEKEKELALKKNYKVRIETYFNCIKTLY
jgi:hypothetical protein